ncbi:hypothetical protein LEP1GSC068_1536 [Leptospira sp. Fiocruz LV3954]|uniref:Uncharacterized protein n=1 Tax=Leptospira santarosai TaxID=28183 RepID=A0AB73MAJ4_9LEPT|nr:hypothetical protein LEP1GSC068_1536 [Leptospira sp. Fiocruz LV3954]EMI61908.1 hypothetical protein LEP1GSC076_1978 [Leptospira sp. Fiocruz LV4135]ONF92846.1 hypothetical protein BWD14_11050 [Leptospira santarosai]
MKLRIFFRTKNKERGYDLESQYDQSEESRPRTGIPPRPKAEGFISENKSTEEPVENPTMKLKKIIFVKIMNEVLQWIWVSY